MINEKEDPEDGSYEEVEEVTSLVEDTEDGGAIVTMGEDNSEESTEHFANIVDEVNSVELETVVTDLVDKISLDKKSREKRDELYEEGLRRTGLGDDAPGGAEFSGATRVVHPLLIESCVDFSARVTKELLPPTGPVKTKIFGQANSEKLRLASRKADFMNWQLTTQMQEFRSEIEQLSTQLPLGGVQYLKMYWTDKYKRPVSEFIPVDDIYLPFAATNFYSAERKTHVQYVTQMEFEKRVAEGMYHAVDLAMPQDPEYSRASLANDKIEGRESQAYNEDGLRTIFEVYTMIDFGEGYEPYILSIDKTTEQALSLYRNWDPEDAMKKELDWIIEFPFIPWRGAYPIGLTHLIGGLAAGSTGALRALLDSAHINNLPTMLKLKGGPNGQTLNLSPTEVSEIEGGVNIDDIRKIAMPLPFNAPSQVLFNLLGFLVDAGKGVVQTSFEKLGDTSQQQPVGTTMALIEQGMAVFSSIHSRLHASMARALDVLHRINASYLTDDIIQQQLGDFELQLSDFDNSKDIIPVSDPHIFSETQRFAQIQAVLQRSTALPQLYDIRKTEELFLRQLKMKPEDVLKDLPGKEDRDPMSENVSATMGQPIAVIPKQDHRAHLQVHISFLQSPLFGKNPVMSRALLPLMIMHLRDHLLNYYLQQSKKAIQMAQEQDKIEEDTLQQAQVAQRTQQAVEQEFGQLSQLLAQLDEAAKQMTQGQQPPQDSSLQIAQMNVQLQQTLQQMRGQIDGMKLELDREKFQGEQQYKQMKLQLDKAKLDREIGVDESKIEQQTAIKAEEIKSKEFMNTSDNETAMAITKANIEAGKKSSMTTGTGINP